MDESLRLVIRGLGDQKNAELFFASGAF